MPEKRKIAFVFVLALTLRVVYGLVMLSQGFLAVSEGDYTLYQVGAEHIRTVGDFTNSLFLVRPPLFPLVVALLQDNHTLIILFNALLGAILVVLTALMAVQLRLDRRIALLAAVLVAVDPVSIRYTAFLGPEALSFVGALGMVNALLALLKSRTLARACLWGVFAAAALLISAYTRPSIYLIWTGLGVWVAVQRWRYLPAVLCYMGLSFAGVYAWQVHNGQQFGNQTFSTVGTYTMTYYRAVSVLRLGEGLSQEDAYTEINRRIRVRLGQDPALATADDRHHYLAASPEVEAALNETNREIFLDYPLIYGATLGLGVIRFLDIMPDFPPVENLINPLLYPVPLWNLGMLILMGYGLYSAMRERLWCFVSLVVLFGGYFSAGTLLVKSAGMTGRERTVIFPVMALCAAYGLYRLYQQRRLSVNS